MTTPTDPSPALLAALFGDGDLDAAVAEMQRQPKVRTPRLRCHGCGYVIKAGEPFAPVVFADGSVRVGRHTPTCPDRTKPAVCRPEPTLVRNMQSFGRSLHSRRYSARCGDCGRWVACRPVIGTGAAGEGEMAPH